MKHVGRAGEGHLLSGCSTAGAVPGTVGSDHREAESRGEFQERCLPVVVVPAVVTSPVKGDNDSPRNAVGPCPERPQLKIPHLIGDFVDSYHYYFPLLLLVTSALRYRQQCSTTGKSALGATKISSGVDEWLP
jgi:hypothetical protein